MNDKDLKYLLDYTKNYKRQQYKFVTFSPHGSHQKFLDKNNINHQVSKETKPGVLFSIFDKSNKHKLFDFKHPYHPNNHSLARHITNNKFTAEQHFLNMGFKTTQSKLYKWNDIETAYDETFYQDPERNVVIKPLSSALGKGVYVNVTKRNFKEIWKSSVNDLSKSERENIDSLEYLVQDVIEGFEARATIMQGNLLSIVVRIPPFVIGDGKSTIKSLVEKKNKIRNQCRYQKHYPIKITKKIEIFLRSQSRKLADVPLTNEPVLLSSISNINAGGELFNITELVDDSIKEFALDVLASVPGMFSCGLDILMKSFDDEAPTILEVNAYPNITIPKYTTFGESVNVSKIIIESLIAQNQIGLSTENKYEIENEEEYLRNFINFVSRKQKFIELNYKEHKLPSLME